MMEKWCPEGIAAGIVWSKAGGLKKYSFEISRQASDHGEEHSMMMVMANTNRHEL